MAGSWQLAGLTDDLQASGDFVTTDVAGNPLILWREGDTYQAFLNVCAHRFCTITDAAKGRAERLRCQYHGWEYDTCGDLRKIPDSTSFRPLKKGQLALAKLPTASCGKVILVNTTPRPESCTSEPLTSGLAASELVERPTGALPKVLSALFPQNRVLVDRFECNVPANWKVIVENAVESYHVGCVHANTFSAVPTADTCRHELTDDYSKFETDFPSNAPLPVQWMERAIHRALGREYVEQYTHYHFLPNLMVSTGKMFSSLMSIQPLSADRSRMSVALYGDPGPRRNPIAWAAFRCASWYAKKEVRKIIREDLAVLPSLQKGLQSPQLPGKGLISVREERVHHFQRYISDRVGQ